jgi:hemerythrin-like domain-containing protein
MDVFDVITSDHEKVKKLFAQLEETTEKTTKGRQELLEKLEGELLPHMHAEEQYFYQILLDESEESEEKKHIYEAIEEHRAARHVLADIHELSFEDPRWAARVQVLQELVEHHIEEEESEVFEIAHDVIDESRAQTAATRFQELKKEAPAHAG